MGEIYEHESQRISLRLLDSDFIFQNFYPTGTYTSLPKIKFLEYITANLFHFKILIIIQSLD